MFETLQNILALTAWEMEKPAPYGPLHLSFTLIGFFLSFFIAYKLRNLNRRNSNILIFGVGLFLILCEVYKQLMYEVVLEPGLPYRWGNFSFHMCSIPMYLCMIIPFCKEGNVRRSMCGFLMTFNLLGGFISFFEPSGLLKEYWTLTFHALVWHMMLVFLGAFIGFSGQGCRNGKEFRNTSILFVILCAMAFAINCALWNVSEHQLNNFFVGPAVSSLIVFKQIGEYFGWYISTILYIPSIVLGAYLFYFLFRWINTKLQNRRSKAAVS